MHTDLTKIGSICDECARRLGFVPKDKVVGVWVGKCDSCGERKPLTDLWHDWSNRVAKKCMEAHDAH